MVVITVTEKDSNEISQLVRELKDSGLKVGIDFDFEFSTGRYDWSTHEHVPRQTKFTFYHDEIAVLFALRWL